MIKCSINVQRDNNEKVIRTLSILATMSIIGNIGNILALRGNLIITIDSTRKHPGGQISRNNSS